MPTSVKTFEVVVRVWDEYVVVVEAESEQEAIDFVEKNINEVEDVGMNSDGGRDVQSAEEIQL